jgi:hypothetical protein
VLSDEFVKISWPQSVAILVGTLAMLLLAILAIKNRLSRALWTAQQSVQDNAIRATQGLLVAEPVSVALREAEGAHPDCFSVQRQV